MEPAKIDWKTIESVFVVDELYEHIKAPKWVDFSDPSPDKSLLDDEAWFCRPDCNHPKTVEDLLKLNLVSKKTASVSSILPMSDRNRSDANLKRRPGLARPLLSSKQKTKSDKFVTEDGENVNPNLYSTPSQQYNNMKSVIESSTEKNKKKQTDKQKQLRSTLSARNLFGGRDIVNQITEFCSELKRLVATRAKEREPLLVKEVDKALDKSNIMEEEKEVNMTSNKKLVDTENTQPNYSYLDLNNKKKKNTEAISAAQNPTRPPSPQCFSTGRSPRAIRTPTIKPASKSRLQGRGILQELEQKNKELIKNEAVDYNNTTNYDQEKTASPVILEPEAPPSTLNVFWFLKPCTRLSS